LVAASQVIVIALPLTARSRELLDAATLGRARPGAFVVNVGRGSVADEAAVADASSGTISAGAASKFGMKVATARARAQKGMPVVLTKDPTDMGLTCG
jgi:lactate dehydrogenase-like 2-hydroxyacid dehydrogenase